MTRSGAASVANSAAGQRLDRPARQTGGVNVVDDADPQHASMAAIERAIIGSKGQSAGRKSRHVNAEFR